MGKFMTIREVFDLLGIPYKSATELAAMAPEDLVKYYRERSWGNGKIDQEPIELFVRANDDEEDPIYTGENLLIYFDDRWMNNEKEIRKMSSNEKPIYIHYGHDKFVCPNPIVNKWHFTKPKGGLWASRKNDDYAWKNWCEVEEYRLDQFDTCFEFTLKDGARVLELNHENQIVNLPMTQKNYKISRDTIYYLDFEKLKEQYDAIEVTDINRLYWALYGWDCNSILIMNPDIVEIIYEGATRDEL